MDAREHALRQWLTTHCQFPRFEIQALAGDASFRRYFRVQVMDGVFIAMDAPPPQENCQPYIAIANALRLTGLNTPEILASNVEEGFLLITDFGDHLLLKELNPSTAKTLYTHALDALVILQSCSKVKHWQLPFFTAEFMRAELELFKEWFLYKHLQLPQQSGDSLNVCFDFLATTAAEQPQVFMHRDYHSANLMVLPHNRIGILDFQDAFIGPVTYDLVSLLRDCYIAWPDALVTQLLLQYKEKLNRPEISTDDFIRWFDLMGLQRHLKALMTFARKLHRDQNANYIKHIPRTVEYIQKISERYVECKSLHELMTQRVSLCVE